MKKIITLLTIITWLYAPLSLHGQTRRALVIGLGEQLDNNWSKINGDKDVPYVTFMLQRCDYEDIKTLVNKEATKDGIVSAFRALTSRCNKGDIVYIHYSGHGQQVTDINGDEGYWDESWIPYDAYIQPCKNDKGEKHLIDDEVGALLTKIKEKIGPKGKLLVVVDACHSGDSDLCLSPVETDSVIIRGVVNKFNISKKNKNKSPRLPKRWLMLSACKSGQINQELTQLHVGRLTYILYLLVNKGGVTMENIEKMMQKYPTKRRQTPTLSGDEKESYNLSDVLK